MGGLLANRIVRVVVLALLFVGSIQALRPIISYRALELGAGPGDLGFIAASYGLLSLGLSVPLGRWGDRFGERLLLTSGAVTVGLTMLALAAAESLLGLGAAHAAFGLGHVTGIVGLQSLVANDGPADRADRRVAALAVGVATGQMIGPPAAAYLYAATDRDFVTVALAGASITMVALLLALTLRPTRRVDQQASRRTLGDDVGAVLRVASVRYAMLASLVALTSIDLMLIYLPAYGEARGLDAGMVGTLLGVFGAGSLSARLLMAWLVSKIGRQSLLVGGLLGAALALFVLSLTDAVVALFVLSGAAGFGLGLGQPLSLVWIIARVPVAFRGTAIGVRLTANRGAQLVIPAAVGLVAETVGLAGAFLTTSGALAASAGLIGRYRDTEAADQGEEGAQATAER